MIAARAFDARWTIGGGGHDVQLAEVLTTWAERDEDASRDGRSTSRAARAAPIRAAAVRRTSTTI